MAPYRLPPTTCPMLSPPLMAESRLDPSELLERERRRLVVRLRKLADCIEAASPQTMREVNDSISPYTTRAFQEARSIFGGDFGQ